MTPQQQKWSFNPKEEKTYVLEPVLLIWPIQNPNYNKSILTLKVMGKGAKGFIQVRLFTYPFVLLDDKCRARLFKKKNGARAANEHKCGFAFPAQAIKDVLEMGDTMVGRAQSIDVPLVNNSTCSISFSVSIEQTLQDEQLHPDLQPAAVGISSSAAFTNLS